MSEVPPLYCRSLQRPAASGAADQPHVHAAVPARSDPGGVRARHGVQPRPVGKHAERPRERWARPQPVPVLVLWRTAVQSRTSDNGLCQPARAKQPLESINAAYCKPLSAPSPSPPAGAPRLFGAAEFTEVFDAVNELFGRVHGQAEEMGCCRAPRAPNRRERVLRGRALAEPSHDDCSDEVRLRLT